MHRGQSSLYRRAAATLLLVSILSLTGCVDGLTSGGRPITETVIGDWIRVYFTNPRYPDDPSNRTTGIDADLAALIDAAQDRVDVAGYDIDLGTVADALIRARQANVEVRVVTDGSNADEEAVTRIRQAGISVVARPDTDWGIMHNKFVVFDADASDPIRPVVWTGSTNFTYAQINTDPNNVIIIQDQSLARTFRLEFNEMFGSEGAQPDPAGAKFGPDKADNTPHEFIIDGKRVECYFSPTDGTHESILDAIESSGHSIHVATMLITKEDIGDALALKGDLGQNVQVLINDYDQYGEPIVNILVSSLGEDFRLKGEPGFMHHKYMIVDQEDAQSDPRLLTGSHNWSNSARVRNDENTLIIHDQGVANAYYQEFVERFSAGKLLVSDRGPGSLFQSEDGIHIYPNPASKYLTITSETGNEPTRVRLVDPAGRKMKEYHTLNSPTINISDIPDGLYILQITLSGGDQVTKKITINK